jgi:RND family efflux transporter MFP subunit
MKKILMSLCFGVMSLWSQEVYATFYVEAKQDAALAFTASGIVEQVYSDIGSVVKKDAVLASLENSESAALVASAQTTLKYAQRDYARQEKVQALIDEAKFDGYAKAYESAKNQLAYQEALHAKTYLRAPFDGVVYAKAVEVGDAVSGMMLKTVFQIQSKDARKLVLEFDQKYYATVKIGDTFTYTLDGSDKKYSGVITKIYPHAMKESAKMQAEVEAKGFVVGLFGDGMIHTKE